MKAPALSRVSIAYTSATTIILATPTTNGLPTKLIDKIYLFNNIIFKICTKDIESCLHKMPDSNPS